MGSYTIERFGSIHPRVQTNCGLGNTIPGQELEWVSVNGLLVSSRPIKFNISWDRLNKEGLVYGKKIAIDGKSYTCLLYTSMLPEVEVGNLSNRRCTTTKL